MSPADQFLADVLDGAQKLADGGTLNWWKGTCVDIAFPDPLRPEQVGSTYAALLNRAYHSSRQLCLRKTTQQRTACKL
jgi:hypothetical protein